MSKKDKLLKAGSRIQNREEEPLLDKQSMARKIKSPTSQYKRALFTLEYGDLEELKDTVDRINQQTKRKTNKSELVRIGINLLKDKSPQEILGLLNNM